MSFALFMSRSPVRAFAAASLAGLLAGCGFFGEGDNSPTIFDSQDEQAARADRRAESPGRKIHGKMYRFIDVVIDGKTSVPESRTQPNLTLEEGLVKGVDGCASFRGRGIFTPSGYEYTLRGSEDFKTAPGGCEGGDVRWAPVYELNGQVWKLSIASGGILTLTEYEKGQIIFRLRPVN